MVDRFKPPNRAEIAHIVNGGRAAIRDGRRDERSIRSLERLFRGVGQFLPDAIDGKLGAPAQFIFVDNKSDLPDAVGGVITLENSFIYYFVGEVDLEGDRILVAERSTIIGAGPDSSGIVSTGLGASDALITSDATNVILTLGNVYFTAATGQVFDLTGTDPAYDWTRVNIIDSPDMGIIDGSDNLIIDTMGILNSSNLVLDGTHGTVGFTDTIFVGRAGQTTLEVPATATITRRIRFSLCAIVAFGGATGFDVSASASILNEGYIIQTSNFSGGATYLGGLNFADDKARFEGNRGITNTAALANYFFSDNTTATTIAALNTPVKAAGVTTANTNTQKFILTANRATYDGSLPRLFMVNCVISATANTGPEMGLYIAKNGVVDISTLTVVELGAANRASNISTMGIFSLVQGDFLEVWIENRDTTADITVEDLKFVAIETGG